MLAINNTYTILDSTRIYSEFEISKTLELNFLSLYMGKNDESQNSGAPHLFTFQNDSEFAKWLMGNGWGNSWGIFIETQLIIEELRKHLRRFLIVKSEEGTEMYFRFYDPRVLRIFLPTCDEEQVKEFFGPVERFIVEGETREEAILFSHQNGILKKEIVPAEEIFGDTIRKKPIPDEE